MIKKLRVKKEYGVWYYEKYKEIDVDWELYNLFNDKMECVGTFGIYNDMKYFIENGINLSM